MKPSIIVVSFSLLLLMNFCSCSKSSSSTPTPTPSPKPDTLSAGWTKIKVQNTGADIVFVSATTGYFLGNELYKSTNGGTTWSKLTLHTGNWENMTGTPDGKIFIVGNPNTIARSVDGGSSFTEFFTGLTPLNDVFFIDNNTGYTVYSSGILQTTDGGITWPSVTPITGLTIPSNVYTSCYFINSSTGWISAGSSIYKTNGSINNWSLSNLSGGSPASGDLASLYAPSPSVVYAGFASGKIFRSIDGGANFSMVKDFGNGLSYTDIQFIDVSTGYVSTGNRIYKTMDGGATWQTVVALGETIFSEIHFIDATHGWACTNDGNVLRFN